MALLQLLQLADSAMPVGAAAHSFGLESLIEEGMVTVEGLESFLQAYLQETGALEAVFCREAHRLSQLHRDEFASEWRNLNQRLSARKLARESRDASLTLGRRFLRLVSELLPEEARLDITDGHHVTAFGLVAGLVGIDEASAVLGWLHQSTTALVSAAQRLAPLGQTRASKILWRLKPLMREVGQVDDLPSSETNDIPAPAPDPPHNPSASAGPEPPSTPSDQHPTSKIQHPSSPEPPNL
jgi:urease accessory protein